MDYKIFDHVLMDGAFVYWEQDDWVIMVMKCVETEKIRTQSVEDSNWDSHALIAL